MRIGVKHPTDEYGDGKQQLPENECRGVLFRQLGGARFLGQCAIEQTDDMGQARTAAGTVGAYD